MKNSLAYMKNEMNYLQQYARDLIDNSLDCISTSDVNGNIVLFNKAAEKTFGYSAVEIELLGYDVMFASKEESVRIHEALKKNGSYQGEVINRRKNGEIFTSYLTSNLVYNDAGELVGSMGISRDISEEKRHREHLKQKLEENKRLLDANQHLLDIATSVTNGIVEKTPEGTITWCNSSFEKMTGYSLLELEGSSTTKKLLTPAFFEAQSRIIEQTGPHFNVPVQYARYKKNGELFWVLVESTAIRDFDGELIKIIDVCTEITEQKNAEMALIASEHNFHQISATIEDVFYLYNIELMKYEFISPNCLEVLGASQDFFYEGKKHTENFVLLEDQLAVLAAKDKIERGESYDIEFRMSINGKIKWIRERSNAIYNDEGKAIKNSGICTDITLAKKNLELIEEQNRAITESMVYARRIQNATLPSPKEISELFENNFVLFQPKSEISGDFFLASTTRTSDSTELKVFLVADCTGHGIPGGILSILCNNLVKQSLTEHSVHSPGQALNWIKKQLDHLFHSNNEQTINDGMDVGFGVYNPNTQEITFAGANLSCLIVRNNELIQIKGDRQHVGYSEDDFIFSDETVKVYPGDNIYLSTDGIMDQFGGDANKKFMRKQFITLLKEISALDMPEQKQIIYDSFMQWKGANEQTDDICIFGIKL